MFATASLRYSGSFTKLSRVTPACEWWRRPRCVPAGGVGLRGGSRRETSPVTSGFSQTATFDFEPAEADSSGVGSEVSVCAVEVGVIADQEPPVSSPKRPRSHSTAEVSAHSGQIAQPRRGTEQDSISRPCVRGFGNLGLPHGRLCTVLSVRQ